jgi:hypothetical protein
MSSSELAAAVADAKAQIPNLNTDISKAAAILRDLYTQRAAAAAADRVELTKDIDYWRGKESKLESLLVLHTQRLTQFESMQHGTSELLLIMFVILSSPLLTSSLIFCCRFRFFSALYPQLSFSGTARLGLDRLERMCPSPLMIVFRLGRLLKKVGFSTLTDHRIA